MRFICLVLIVCALALRAGATVKEDNSTEVQASQTEQVSYCPEGWEAFKETCLYFSEDKVSFWQLDRVCNEFDSQPVEIQSKELHDFIQEKADEKDTSFWLFLYKRRGYAQPYRWRASGKELTVFYESDLDDSVWKEKCVSIMSEESGYQDSDNCEDENQFVCQKKMECIPGRFGPGCMSECHCIGEPCDTAKGVLTCKWGCKQGWTGPRCSKVKEQPEVRYFCINSPDEHVGSYVDVHVHTKGVNYRSIYAQMANSTERGPWCSGTTVSPADNGHDHVSITIRVNDTIADEIRDGVCVGQELAKNQYEWTLVVEEYEGILLDSDIQVVISCDFNNSETLQRDSQSGLSDAQTFAEKVELSPETTDVTLEVVDPFNHQVVTEASVGSAVKLHFKFGFNEGSLLKGVRPHNCVASTPDGQMVKELLGERGCNVRGSPVESFSRDVNSTTSMSTKSFPLFAFANYREIEFKCSFDLCFHYDNCEPGCRGRFQRTRRHRHRRSASDLWPEFEEGQGIDWRSRVIQILPDIFPLKETTVTKGPTTTEKQPEIFLGRYGLGGENRHNQEPHVDQTPPAPEPQLPATKSPHSRHEVDLYYYLLSPVTCGVILLLILVSTITFLIFHFNLRRTVDDMRHEMLQERRPRDRALHFNSNKS